MAFITYFERSFCINHYKTYKTPPTTVFWSISRWNISLCVPEWTPILICGREKEAANRVPPKEDWFFLNHSLKPTNRNAFTSSNITHHSRMHTNVRLQTKLKLICKKMMQFIKNKSSKIADSLKKNNCESSRMHGCMCMIFERPLIWKQNFRKIISFKTPFLRWFLTISRLSNTPTHEKSYVGVIFDAEQNDHKISSEDI